MRCMPDAYSTFYFIMEPSHTPLAGDEGYKNGAPAVHLPPNVHYIGALDDIM